ncbi:MAG: radical SAM protein [Halobacteriaceae archaeon]
MSRPRVDTRRRPLVFVWEVTRACELACRHCRAAATPERHPDELTTAEGKALLDAARRFGEGQLVVLSGGDPLVRSDLAELVAYGTDIGLRMTLTPSGTTSLTEAKLRELRAAGLSRLALSLDAGVPEAHDAFRGESGSFETTLRAARMADEVSLPLQINTTVCGATVDELPEVRDLVAELEARLWSVFFLVPVGRGRVLEQIPPSRADAVMEWLDRVDQGHDFGVKTTEAPQYRRVKRQIRPPGEAADGPEAPGAGIIAGDGFAFVSHTGDIYPSGFLPNPVGNVRNEDVVSVYRNHQLFEQLRDRDALSGKCGACEFRGVCGGSRSRAYAHTGDPLAADPLCPYLPEGYDGPLPSPPLGRETP